VRSRESPGPDWRRPRDDVCPATAIEALGNVPRKPGRAPLCGTSTFDALVRHFWWRGRIGALGPAQIAGDRIATGTVMTLSRVRADATHGPQIYV
jgi:hypothetical protein